MYKILLVTNSFHKERYLRQIGRLPNYGSVTVEDMNLHVVSCGYGTDYYRHAGLEANFIYVDGSLDTEAIAFLGSRLRCDMNIGSAFQVVSYETLETMVRLYSMGRHSK